MSFQPVNPKPYLTSLINSQVVVKLKFNNIEYHGKLLSIDNYMNLLLDSNVKEYNLEKPDDEPVSLGNELFIRCNNVLWIGEEQEIEKEEENEDKEEENGEKVEEDVEVDDCADEKDEPKDEEKENVKDEKDEVVKEDEEMES
ncbi:unnamed protein product [[Candida] boidinii]|uniref:Unnamed protein product n=1 Tax=Candida boidinii TaxID=5477 RepID=A0A9W6T3Y3_CANBO|nr:hypothetical protein B5S30_g1411 [[Candida] boidinii]GME75670.1 unnamed protein product [[Candida] boidinii]